MTALRALAAAATALTLAATPPPAATKPAARTPPPAADPGATIDRVLAAARFDGVAIAGGVARPTMVSTRGASNRADAPWRWASVTKQLTAVIVMQEVAAGRLALDAPITAYWPDWPQVFADEVTIRDLLRHTTGLADPNEDGPNLPDGLPAFYRPAPGRGTMQWSATHYCAEHPRAKPGGGFHYNNCDTIVLGALLERTTGRSFATLIEERIARPAGARIGLFAPGRPPAAPGPVRGIARDGRPDVIGDLGVYGAAGSAYGTPLALLAVDKALLGHRLLDPASTDAMWTGEPRLGYAALGSWAFAAPLRGCAGPVRIVERRGQIGGVQVRNFIMPDVDRALILFTRFEAFDFGEVWQGRGFAYDALSATVCA